MHPPKNKESPEDTPRDRYDISGKVEGQAVVVQGSNAHVEVKQTQLTPEEIRQETKRGELKLLQLAVSQKIETVKELIREPLQSQGNPFYLGQPLGLNESSRLFGREKDLNNVLEQVNTSRATFIVGNSGIGKTSLMQAGVIPALTKKGNLAILVSVSMESLEVSIKRQFIDNIANTEYLRQIPLSTFLRHVCEILNSKKLFILIDRIEDFLERFDDEIHAFITEWKYCINSLPRLHWLFSFQPVSIHLLNAFKPDINPFQNMYPLEPLEREATQHAILEPAMQANIQIEAGITDDILDQLGPKHILPCQLQTVCYILAGGNQPLVREWTMETYRKQGRAKGILQKALEQIVRQFKLDEREAIWQILNCLVEQREYIASWATLSERLKSYDLDAKALKDLMTQLEDNHLIEIEDNEYRLATPHFAPRIQQWAADLAASQRAEMETKRQFRHFLNSSLRGLVGGAIGFILFDQLIYTDQVSIIDVFISMIMTGSIGAVSGFLLTFSADISLAAYRGRSDWHRYLIGGGVGIAATMALISTYVSFNYLGNALIEALPLALFEAAAWGVTIGLGITLGMSAKRYIVPTVLAVSILSGLVLMGAESFGGALINEAWNDTPTLLRVFIAGTITPLFYMATALWGRSDLKGNKT